MEKKKRFSILKLLIVIICISSVIVSLAANVLFSRKNYAAIFGRYVYIVDASNPMGDDITTGAALLAKDASDISISNGDIVLCYPASEPEKLVLRSINSITENDDGSQNYYTKSAAAEDEGSITKDKIAALCTGYPESYGLGQFILFATSIKGILSMLVLASVILVIFLISAIVSSRSESDFDDDEFGFYEYDETPKAPMQNPALAPAPAPALQAAPVQAQQTQAPGELPPVNAIAQAPPQKPAAQKPVQEQPLFKPGTEPISNPELERKKMSIAENFSQKEVNPDSPYQKERERTMQFKAQQVQRGSSLSNTMSFSATSSAESSFAARNRNTQSGAAPTADALREEMLRKTAEAERTSTFQAQKSAPETKVPDNTGVLSKAQVEQLSRGGEPSDAVKAAQAVFAQRKEEAAPKKSSSPDISDIIGKTESARRKKNPSDMSVDDLLKMIEEEKKKL